MNGVFQLVEERPFQITVKSHGIPGVNGHAWVEAVDLRSLVCGSSEGPYQPVAKAEAIGKLMDMAHDKALAENR